MSYCQLVIPNLLSILELHVVDHQGQQIKSLIRFQQLVDHHQDSLAGATVPGPIGSQTYRRKRRFDRVHRPDMYPVNQILKCPLLGIRLREEEERGVIRRFQGWSGAGL